MKWVMVFHMYTFSEASEGPEVHLSRNLYLFSYWCQTTVPCVFLFWAHASEDLHSFSRDLHSQTPFFPSVVLDLK